MCLARSSPWDPSMVVTSFPTLALPAPSRDAVAEEPSALESGPLSEEAAAAPSPAAFAWPAISPLPEWSKTHG